MTAKAKLLTIGELLAQAAIFQSPFAKNYFYVVGRDDMDYLEFMQRYDTGDKQHKRATGLALDDSGERFFLLCVADCFDPPVAIVRARNESDAYETFVDELAWAHITDENDLKDYLKPASEWERPDCPEYVDSLSFNCNGVPYDGEGIQMQEVKLYAVENH
jgi:hypothetical protein